MKRARTAVVCTWLALMAFPIMASKAVKIPKTRVRIIYKETGQPVEWVQLSISCWAKWRSRAEKKAYQKKIGGWEASKETTYGGGRFLHAEDGWITIPEVSDVRMDSYEIEIVPAAGCVFYPPKPPETGWGEPVGYFDEKTFPKFAALPEKERVLESSFTAQCAIASGTLNPNYEEARYFLAAYKIIMDHWPELSAALGCGYDHGGHAPYFKSGYWGFMTNCCLTMRSYIDPSYSLHGVPVIPAAQRADLLEHARALFCADIKAKQALWGETGVSPDLLELDFFKSLHCECMGVKGLPPCKKKTTKTAPSPPAKEGKKATPEVVQKEQKK